MKVVVFAVTLTGCDGGVSFNPVAPSFQPFTLRTGRSVEFIASLSTQQGSCLEATILYDGLELEGARAECGRADGCARLDFTGVARSASGRLDQILVLLVVLTDLDGRVSSRSFASASHVEARRVGDRLAVLDPAPQDP